jgi:2-dehydro-3-deoxyphosphogluconate aldolase/(4S)-4-hydroxy-2-oxoglutarate aldolase
MPTGGVSTNRENLKSWFDAGVTCVGIGSQLISSEILANKDFEGLRLKVQETLLTIKELRS